MARTKRPSPFLENPPTASSSEEEEAEEEEIGGRGREAEDGSDSDDLLKKKSTEENNKNDSDADSDDLSEFSKKPKPNVEAPKPKRLKVERIWTEEDEIVILGGLKEWKSKGKAWNKVTGLIPPSALDEFLDGIKESLHLSPVKKEQLSEKIKRLKSRYLTAMKNRNYGDEDPVFSIPHECRMYLFMKDIWADFYARMSGNVVNAAVDDSVEVSDDDNDKNVKVKWELLDNLPVLGMKECFTKEDLRLIGASKVKKFEKRWKKLLKEELDVNLRRMKLIQETTEAVLEAIESSKD